MGVYLNHVFGVKKLNIGIPILGIALFHERFVVCKTTMLVGILISTINRSIFASAILNASRSYTVDLY